MQKPLITIEGGSPKRRLSLVSAYLVCGLAAAMPLKLQVAFTFVINFIYNHVLATLRLVGAYASMRFSRLLVLLCYYLVLGPTALAARLLGRDYLHAGEDDGSYFTPKEPPDSTEEHFLRQF